MKKTILTIALGAATSSIWATEWQCDVFGKVQFDAAGQTTATYERGAKKGSWKVEVLGNSDDGIESKGRWESEDQKENGVLFLVRNRKKVNAKYGKGEEKAKRSFNCKVIK